MGRAYVNGSTDTLQRLIANGIPVLVAGWLKADEDIGHYRLVKGYDRTAGVLIVNDSYLGPDLRFPLAYFDALWWPFNRVYVPIYRPQQEEVVRAIVGGDADKAAMFRK
ncbi:MAG: C39 family peptidase, partial [candidate division NC10 bacterium]